MNVLEYIIRAKDATASGVRSALDRVKSFAASVGRNLMNIKAGIEMLGSAARQFWSVFKKAFAFETMTVHFKTLIGSMDEAREHMKMLQELGATPPFSLEQFAAASRTLMVMTDNVLGFKGSLELIGDAAAATGQNIDSLAHHIGLAFASIRDGAPITRATFALRSMGVITPAVAEKLDELQKSGASTVEIWQVLEGHLKRFEGAMKETEKTGDGLVGAIQSQWDISVRTFGEAFMEASKDGLGYLLEKMKELNEDGTIEEWAGLVVKALGRVASAIKWVVDGIGAVYDHLKAGKDAWSNILSDDGVGKNAEKKDEETFQLVKEWKDDETPYMTKRRYLGSRGSERLEEEVDVAAKKKFEKEQREQKRLAEERARQEEKERRKQEALEEAQRKLDEKAAKAEAEKEAEEERKAAEKYAEEKEKYERELADWEERESERLLMEEERERIKIEQKIAAERHRYLQKELSERQSEERDAQSRLAEAQQKVRQAWGWYRDKDSLKAQLEEEKAEAEAQKQYVKDFENLKRWRSDWRTADNLSLDEEAVRRVALAKEEETSAQQAVLETAENTRRAADALEELLAADEEGE